MQTIQNAPHPEFKGTVEINPREIYPPQTLPVREIVLDAGVQHTDPPIVAPPRDRPSPLETFHSSGGRDIIKDFESESSKFVEFSSTSPNTRLKEGEISSDGQDAAADSQSESPSLVKMSSTPPEFGYGEAHFGWPQQSQTAANPTKRHFDPKNTECSDEQVSTTSKRKRKYSPDWNQVGDPVAAENPNGEWNEFFEPPDSSELSPSPPHLYEDIGAKVEELLRTLASREGSIGSEGSPTDAGDALLSLLSPISIPSEIEEVSTSFSEPSSQGRLATSDSAATASNWSAQYDDQNTTCTKHASHSASPGARSASPTWARGLDSSHPRTRSPNSGREHCGGYQHASSVSVPHSKSTYVPIF